ncbi:MAG TPA: hypothetical protein VJ724_06770, partial [Tahibacter sp.]|nr:hypothetical protein [Tahibacter sp.]
MRRLRQSAAAAIVAATLTVAAHGATPLSDIPLYSASNVPANLMLALSVEFPTGVVAAYTDNRGTLAWTDAAGATRTLSCGGRDGNGYGVCFFADMKYLGYFDNAKCYDYDATNRYFVPVGAASSGGGCAGDLFSGNMLNWASMTALDEFRQVLTGGNRSTDTAGLTVLQRSRQVQSGNGNFPVKRLSAAAIATGGTTVPASALATLLPTSSAKLFATTPGN